MIKLLGIVLIIALFLSGCNIQQIQETNTQSTTEEDTTNDEEVSNVEELDEDIDNLDDFDLNDLVF